MAVLVAGVVAAVLNLILPQEDAPDEEEEPQVEVIDVEAHHPETPKEKHAD